MTDPLFDDSDRHFGNNDVGNPAVPCTITRIHDVRIVNETSGSFPKIDKARKTTHRVASSVGHATKDEVLEALRLVEAGDIVAWSLHTWFPASEKDKADPVATGVRSGTLVPFGSGDGITISEITTALGSQQPPAVVIMCGCATGQFMQRILGAGAAIAFGVARAPGGDTTLPPLPTEIMSMNAVNSITASLMNGESISDAAFEGTNALKGIQLGKACTMIMDFRVRAGLSANKSLEDNHLL